MSTKSFSEAYGTLQRNAEKLRNQSEPDLDNLLEVVTQSVQAYKVCKSRIDAVELALEQALSGAGLAEGGSEVSRPAVRPAPRPAPAERTEKPAADSSGFDNLDDDIPF